MRHIEEAKKLSAELGGTDADVKSYFFSLSRPQLRPILEEYQAIYGQDARAYAEKTLAKWQSGRVHMSGLVAARLFHLLPPHMPLAKKHELAENLWRHLGPRSKKVLRVGLDARMEDAVSAIKDHIAKVVVEYRIPEQLERRFDWLAAGDVQMKQHLLNHLQKMEKTLVVQGAELQLPVMLDHLRSDNTGLTTRLAQILKIGNHELEVRVDRHATGVTLQDWVTTHYSTSGSLSWLFWLVGLGFLLFLLAR